MVGKRRLFSRKRRVRGAKTSFSDPKDFVFLRKDAVFFPLNLVLPLERRYFGRKSPQNTENFHRIAHFAFMLCR